MIFGIGIDIIEVSRVEKELLKPDNSLQKDVLTKNEIEYCEGKKWNAQYYAARFAAKEAFFKALGTGWRNGLKWQEVEIINDELGKPSFVFHGKPKKLIEENKIINVQLSISHINESAIAAVILET